MIHFGTQGQQILQWTLIASVTLASALLGVFICTYRSLSQFCRRCDEAFESLAVLVNREHLIIDHLLDSLPDDFEQDYQQECRIFREKSASVLAKLRSDPCNPRFAESFSEFEGDLVTSSQRLMEQIEMHPFVSEVPTIASCSKALLETQAKSYLAMLGYNHAVITMTSYRELKRPCLVCRLVGGPPAKRTLIDWTPDVSV